MMPAVSVIIPTYNHRDFVLDALDSVFAQTFTDHEIIVINDGSPDDTSRLLQPLVEQKRIHYVEQPNAGQAAARNRGLALAQGEFIAFLDDDDLWPPEKLGMQVMELRRSKALLVGGWAGITLDGVSVLREQGVRPGTLNINDLFCGSPFLSPGQTLIRRSTLEELGGFDETIWGADDFDLYLRIASLGELRVNRQMSLLYRLHPGNSSNQRELMLENCYKLVQRHLLRSDRTLSRRAFRWLYDYAGSEWIAQAKHSIRKGRVREVLHDFRLLARFAIPAMQDFYLAKQIASDLLPTRLRASGRFTRPSGEEIRYIPR